jgi:hypothetical protein
MSKCCENCLILPEVIIQVPLWRSQRYLSVTVMTPEEHVQRVRELADRLRSNGIDAMIDQYVVSPEEGWPSWIETNINGSDAVLMVCSELYWRRVADSELTA